MFNKPPQILAHTSACNKGSFVTPKFILSKNNNKIDLMNRVCPHRRYPMSNVGDVLEGNIVCKFHGFEWSPIGVPVNNNKKIACGTAETGRSGLVFKDFTEPNHFWVDDLASETNLEFSHVCKGTSKGSWLWMMDIQADLLHIRNGVDVVHPELAAVTNLDEVGMHEGDGWILQTCSTGWWLFVYPFTFVEWSRGCVSVNYTTPHDMNNEFGFDWVTQFYYDPSTPAEKRKEFETLEDVFHEDVQAIENQIGPYFPITTPYNRLEDHCVHYGNWVKLNKNKSI